MSTTNRRDFLTRAAGGAVGVALAGGPLILTARKASAQSGPDTGLMLSAGDAAMNVYRDLVGAGAPNPRNLQSHIATLGAMMSNFNAIGLAEDLGELVVASVNRCGVPNFATCQSVLFSVAQRTPLVQLAYDFFSLHPAAQPSASSVLQIQNGANLMNLSSRYCAALTGWMQNCTYHPHPHLRSGHIVRISDPQQASSDAATAAQVGGAITGGGAALIVASQAVPELLGAGLGVDLAAGFLLGGGIGLVVVGVAVAGYYGYKWIAGQSRPNLAPKFKGNSLSPVVGVI